MAFVKEKLYMITFDDKYPKSRKIADIIGMKRTIRQIEIFTPLIFATCYHIRFEDGEEDLIDVESFEKDGWKFVTLSELLMRGQPNNKENETT